MSCWKKHRCSNIMLVLQGCSLCDLWEGGDMWNLHRQHGPSELGDAQGFWVKRWKMISRGPPRGDISWIYPLYPKDGDSSSAPGWHETYMFRFGIPMKPLVATGISWFRQAWQWIDHVYVRVEVYEMYEMSQFGGTVASMYKVGPVTFYQ